MKVYIVVKSVRYDGYSELEKAFDSEEKANEYIENRYKEIRGFNFMDYFELAVE